MFPSEYILRELGRMKHEERLREAEIRRMLSAGKTNSPQENQLPFLKQLTPVAMALGVVILVLLAT
ncbi:MAG: hypothetical protein GTO14_19245 [Anaerolineales bacterium]|nr:hypothetical protein [Anaerolineales bacterium]